MNPPPRLEQAYAYYLLDKVFQQNVPQTSFASGNDGDNEKNSRIHIRGKDAVLFLTKSGLPRDLLRGVWNVVDPEGIGSLLNMHQFYSLLRLVLLSQKGFLTSADLSTINPPANEWIVKKLQKHQELNTLLPSFEGVVIPPHTDLLSTYLGHDPVPSIEKKEIPEISSLEHLNPKSEEREKQNPVVVNNQILDETSKPISISDAFGDLVQVEDAMLPSLEMNLHENVPKFDIVTTDVKKPDIVNEESLLNNFSGTVSYEKQSSDTLNILEYDHQKYDDKIIEENFIPKIKSMTNIDIANPDKKKSSTFGDSTNTSTKSELGVVNKNGSEYDDYLLSLQASVNAKENFQSEVSTSNLDCAIKVDVKTDQDNLDDFGDFENANNDVPTVGTSVEKTFHQSDNNKDNLDCIEPKTEWEESQCCGVYDQPNLLQSTGSLQKDTSLETSSVLGVGVAESSPKQDLHIDVSSSTVTMKDIGVVKNDIGLAFHPSHSEKVQPNDNKLSVFDDMVEADLEKSGIPSLKLNQFPPLTTLQHPVGLSQNEDQEPKLEIDMLGFTSCKDNGKLDGKDPLNENFGLSANDAEDEFGDFATGGGDLNIELVKPQATLSVQNGNSDVVEFGDFTASFSKSNNDQPLPTVTRDEDDDFGNFEMATPLDTSEIVVTENRNKQNELPQHDIMGTENLFECFPSLGVGDAVDSSAFATQFDQTISTPLTNFPTGIRVNDASNNEKLDHSTNTELSFGAFEDLKESPENDDRCIKENSSKAITPSEDAPTEDFFLEQEDQWNDFEDATGENKDVKDTHTFNLDDVKNVSLHLSKENVYYKEIREQLLSLPQLPDTLIQKDRKFIDFFDEAFGNDDLNVGGDIAFDNDLSVEQRVKLCLKIYQKVVSAKNVVQNWTQLVSAARVELSKAQNYVEDIIKGSFTEEEKSQICYSDKFNIYICGLLECVRVVRMIIATIEDLYCVKLDETKLEKRTISLTILNECKEVEKTFGRLKKSLKAFSVSAPMEMETVAEIRTKRIAASIEDRCFCHLTFQPDNPSNTSKSLTMIQWKKDYFLACAANLWANKVSPFVPL